MEKGSWGGKGKGNEEGCKYCVTRSSCHLAVSLSPALLRQNRFWMGIFLSFSHRFYRRGSHFHMLLPGGILASKNALFVDISHLCCCRRRASALITDALSLSHVLLYDTLQNREIYILTWLRNMLFQYVLIVYVNRMVAHNGEINTLRGNINFMHAREGVMKSKLYGDDLHKLYAFISCSSVGLWLFISHSLYATT